MELLNKITKILSWIALPGLTIYGYILSDEGKNQDSPYYFLFGFSAIMFVVFIFSIGYIINSGRTRLIPEIVYFLAMLGNYKVINEQIEETLTRKLLVITVILSVICRIISFILSSKEYYSSEARSERRVARADYDLDNAEADYEYEKKYGTSFLAEKNAKQKLENARKYQKRVHEEED